MLTSQWSRSRKSQNFLECLTGGFMTWLWLRGILQTLSSNQAGPFPGTEIPTSLLAYTCASGAMKKSSRWLQKKITKSKLINMPIWLKWWSGKEEKEKAALTTDEFKNVVLCSFVSLKCFSLGCPSHPLPPSKFGDFLYFGELKNCFTHFLHCFWDVKG